MDSSIPRCITLLLLILAGGFFSGVETAFSYCNKIRMKTLADDGDKNAKIVVDIDENFDKMLVTVLILINILHVAASAMATVIAISFLPKNPALATLISTIGLTLIVFFVSETIPKSIAKENSDAYARLSARFIYFLVWALTPISFIFTKIGDLFKKIFSSSKPEPAITGDELSDIVESVTDEGMLTDDEGEIIRSAIEFSELTVQDIFTPLEKIITIEKNLSNDEIKDIILNEKYSRIPVYDHDTSHIIGILQTKAYLAALMNGSEDEIDIKDFLSPVYFVRPYAKLDKVFEKMVKRQNHFSIVASSGGAMLGVVTMEDILEEIVGEIYDEDDIESENEGGDPE